MIKSESLEKLQPGGDPVSRARHATRGADPRACRAPHRPRRMGRYDLSRSCAYLPPGVSLPERRVLHLAHTRFRETGAPLAAPDQARPTGPAGAARTETGSVSPGLHVTVQAAPFMRKSSVWVAHSWIGPGRCSVTTEAAARRSQLSTRQITGDSTVTSPPAERPTIPVRTAVRQRIASYDPASDLFLVLLFASLLFKRLRRLFGHRLAGRLVCHVYPLSWIPP